MMLGSSLWIAIRFLRFSIPSSVNAIPPSPPTPTTHSWPSSGSISSATSNSHSSSSPSISATWPRVNTWLTLLTCPIKPPASQGFAVEQSSNSKATAHRACEWGVRQCERAHRRARPEGRRRSPLTRGGSHALVSGSDNSNVRVLPLGEQRPAGYVKDVLKDG